MPSNLSWFNGRSEPGPTKRDLNVLQSTTAQPLTENLGLSMEEAYCMAEKALKGYVRRGIACIELIPRGRMLDLDRHKLPFQVFNELDSEYFRSVLKGNVSLGWAHLPPGVFSRTSRANLKENPRIRIELSTYLTRDVSRFDIFAALIHQMVHAYYLQCCGYRDHGYSGTGHGLEHEQPVSALLKLIGDHCEPLQQILARPLWTLHGRNRGHGAFHPTAGASCCYALNNRYNSTDIQEWCNTAIATAESLQESRTPKKKSPSKENGIFPTDVYSIDTEGKESAPKALEDCRYPREAYIFLYFNGRAYEVARSSVADLGALTSSPHFKDKLWLKLPQGTSEAEFLTFYLFLVHKVYPPMFTDLNEALASSALPNQGPPMIKPHDVNGATPVASLITALNLGRALRYEPFCAFILKGLWSLPSTAENPIVVLEKIYGGQKVWDQPTASAAADLLDSQLREWTRTWLAVRFPNSNEGHYESCYRANLGVLRRHPDWSIRYEQLKVSSPSLKDDDEIAQHHILLKNPCDKDIRRAIMPAPAQHPPTSPDFQQHLPPRDIFNMAPTTTPSNHVQTSHDGWSVYCPSRNGDGKDLAALMDSLHLPGHPWNLMNRTPPAPEPLPEREELRKRYELLQLLGERGLLEGLGARQPEMQPHLFSPQDPQAFPGFAFPPRANQGSGM